MQIGLVYGKFKVVKSNKKGNTTYTINQTQKLKNAVCDWIDEMLFLFAVLYPVQPAHAGKVVSCQPSSCCYSKGTYASKYYKSDRIGFKLFLFRIDVGWIKTLSNEW